MLNSPQISKRFDKASSQGLLFIKTLSKNTRRTIIRPVLGTAFYIGTLDKTVF